MKDNIITMIPRKHHKKNGLKNIRSLLCIILSFILSIVFVGLVVLCVIQWSCFNKNTFYRNLLSSKYYENIQSDIYAKAEAITLPTGLSLEVLDNTIELYKIHQDVNGYMEAGFRGEAYEANTMLMESKLEQNIDQYLRLEEITPDKDQRENAAYYVESISDEYRKAIKIPLLNFLISERDLYNKIYPIGIATCIVVIIFIVSMLIKMNKLVHRTLRYVTYSTTAATFMIAIAPALALYSEFYKRIQLYPLYYYNFAMIFITNIFNTLIHFSIWLAVVSIVLMITIKSMKIKLINKA